MICGNIKHSGTYQNLIENEMWSSILSWISENEKTAKDGDTHQIKGENLVIMVQHIDTKPRAERRFESHKEFLDLHYCIKGGEYIEWAPVESLKLKEPYLEEKDCAFHFPDEKNTAILMTPGTFAIFYPEDAHMPKVHDGENDSILKIVVKIHKSLLVA